MKNAVYVSVWDGDVMLESACLIDEETKELTILESYDVNVNVLEDEYVEIDDTRFPACHISEYNGIGYYYR